jgi:hypothetical protein
LLGRRGIPQGIHRRSGRRLRQVSPGSVGEHAEDRDPSGDAGVLAHCLAGKPPHIDELTEKDLERVAGGTTPTVSPVLITAVYTASAITASAVVSIENGW